MSKGAVRLDRSFHLLCWEVTACMTDTADASPHLDWQHRLDDLRAAALGQLDGATDAAAFEQWRISHLGRRSPLAELLSGLGKMPPDDRRAVGAAANVLKKELEDAFAAREVVVRERELNAALEREQIDVTLPGRPPGVGALHIVTRTMLECVDILSSMGFQVTQTPEVETDYYNFESLNIPTWHPARDT